MHDNLTLNAQDIEDYSNNTDDTEQEDEDTGISIQVRKGSVAITGRFLFCS